MKSRTLELLTLEDRSVPAAGLSSHAPLAEPPAEKTIVTGPAPVAKPAMPGGGGQEAGSGGSGSNGKIATNHNQTLVRDRPSRKPRRR